MRVLMWSVPGLVTIVTSRNEECNDVNGAELCDEAGLSSECICGTAVSSCV